MKKLLLVLLFAAPSAYSQTSQAVSPWFCKTADICGPQAATGGGTTFTGGTVANATTFSQDAQAPGSTVTFNASQTINWQTQGPLVRIQLTANITSFTWSNPTAGGKYILVILQDATGNRTVSWPSGIIWPNNGIPPALSTAANARDYFSMVFDADGLWHVLGEALNN